VLHEYFFENNIQKVLTMTSHLNGEYVEKAITYKQFPKVSLIAMEKIEGRGEISLKMVVKDSLYIGLTYFGSILIGKLV
jgi:hypothetical protein